MRDRLPLNALQAFDRAARAGSFAAAAQELGVTPTAISQHVRLLEDRFGKQVFLRRVNGVELTDAGRELFLRVAGAFSELTEAAAHLKTSASRPRAVLSVIASVGELWLLPRLADLADRAGVQIIEENQDPIDFAGRGVDIRITYGAAAYPGQMVEVLFRDRMVPVAAPLLAAGLRGGRAWCRRRGSDPYPVGADLCQSAVLGRLARGFGQPAPPRSRQGSFGRPPGGCGHGCASGGGRGASARNVGGGGSGTRQPGGRRPRRRPNAPSLCDDCPPRRPPPSGCRTDLAPSSVTRNAAAKHCVQMKNPARGHPAGSVAPLPCNL